MELELKNIKMFAKLLIYNFPQN